MNNYTQMCMQVSVKTPAGWRWLQEQYKALGALQDALEDPDLDLDVSDSKVYQIAAEHAEGPQLDHGLLECVKIWDPLSGTPLPGFDLDVEEDGNVFIEDDGENVMVDHVADFLQVYLKMNDPEGVQMFEYAFTGDKHRPGTFGGGACFVTATDIEWIATNNWLEEQRKKHAPKAKLRYVYEMSVEGRELTYKEREFIESYAESTSGVPCGVRPNFKTELMDSEEDNENGSKAQEEG